MPLFKQVKLLTPESIELDFTLAGIGSRAFALLIDYQILGLSLALFWWLLSLFLSQLTDYLESLETDYSQVPLWVISIGLLASFAIYTGYFVWFEVLWQGQSPGKRITKIRVIRDNGQPVRLAQASLRALLRPIDDILFIGAFFIFFSPREKRIGDWVAGTLVVETAHSRPQKPLLVSVTAQQLARQLPEITELTQLLPDDFAVISEYLHRRSHMTTKARRDLSLKLAREIRAIVNLTELPPGLTSDQFLEAVYLAYQQQFPPLE
jgi:uncharacterized RDD family membrane protein YckC